MLVATFAKRPDLAARTSEIPPVWPEFIHHGQVVNRYWARIRRTATAGQIGWVLLASAAPELVFAPLTMHLYRSRQ